MSAGTHGAFVSGIERHWYREQVGIRGNVSRDAGFGPRELALWCHWYRDSFVVACWPLRWLFARFIAPAFCA